ncbi:MAG: ribosome-associated translation inhibitor RaiA [Planctomycetota bacterium]|nr:ribosome-associated translation inhibitor RaiA [Planctomycetota bacterium]
MRINVVGKGIEITDAIKTHAEGKASKLPRYFDGVQQITLTVAKEDHHKHGQIGVELVVDVEKHEDFVSHAAGEDLYLAIDAAVQKASRQLSDFKEKLKMGNR